MIYSLLAILLIAAVVKIILLKKTAREITDEFADRLKNDTNTLIDVSSHDKDMRDLASSINDQLRILRKEHLQYHQGNTELKKAVTNISHDLRTPLTSALGYIDMINMEAESSGTAYDENVIKELEIIEKRLHRLSELIDAFFEFSKIITSDRLPEKKELVMVSVLEESIAHYYDDYVGRKRSIIFENNAGRQKILRRDR